MRRAAAVVESDETRIAAAQRAIVSDAINLLTQPHNDVGNSARVIVSQGKDLRYVHAHKSWFVFDGTRWTGDKSDQATRRVKHTMQKFAMQAAEAGDKDSIRFAGRSLDIRSIRAALALCECEIYVDFAELDANPDLLNFRNGTLDLRTKTLSPHSREDFITRRIDYDYQPDAECPRFLAFLERIMGGGPGATEAQQRRTAERIRYLQIAFGYSVTGHVSEKVVFVLIGGGNNGKTLLLTIITNCIQEYAGQIQVSSLMTREESNNSQSDLADLCGVRFAQTSETEDGQRLAQAKLKRLTQGMGTIRAVRKYQNPFTFTATHKLWMDTNRRPVIRDAADTATFARLHPIPFDVTIPPEEIDKNLGTKLLTEAPGIVTWLVNGAHQWYATGLPKPEEVEQATRAWREECDQFARFVGEACTVDERSSTGSAAMYAAYRQWCEANGERPVAQADFAKGLQSRGIEKFRTGSGVFYRGVEVCVGM